MSMRRSRISKCKIDNSLSSPLFSKNLYSIDMKRNHSQACKFVGELDLYYCCFSISNNFIAFNYRIPSFTACTASRIFCSHSCFLRKWEIINSFIKQIMDDNILKFLFQAGLKINVCHIITGTYVLIIAND